MHGMYISLSSQSSSNLGPPVIPKSSLSVPQYYISPETSLMVRWMRDTFDFDQTYK